MSSEFVEVISFMSAEEAQLARIHLEEQGIQAHLINESLAGIYGYATRGVRVLVSHKDAGRAHEILHSPPDFNEIDSELPAEFPVDELDADHLSQHDDQPTGQTLGRFRSLKRPVVGLLLAPVLLWVILLLVGTIVSVMPLKWVNATTPGGRADSQSVS